jgi:hypothetical protein
MGSRWSSAAITSALLTFGCSQPPVHEAEIEYSDSWFACDSRFQCVTVYDSFCRLIAVNSKYTRVYQDWSRQEVTREGESAVCFPQGMFVEGAGCRKGRCVYPFGLEDYGDDPKSDK